jgi:hypothetical protein
MPRTQLSLPKSPAGPASPTQRALVLELLTWVAFRPRTYAEAMDVWRTSCPRMPVWEDALDGGLIQVSHSDDVGMDASAVKLTTLGQAFLAGLRDARLYASSGALQNTVALLKSLAISLRNAVGSARSPRAIDPKETREG